MSESENLRTNLVGSNSNFKAMSRLGIKIEMQLSNLGSDDKRTTTYYRWIIFYFLFLPFIFYSFFFSIIYYTFLDSLFLLSYYVYVYVYVL